jgi:hypothetical protein
MTRKIIDKCCDFGDCFFALQGLPACRDICNIVAAKRNEQLWNRVELAADAGVPASMEIVKRANALRSKRRFEP